VIPLKSNFVVPGKAGIKKLYFPGIPVDTFDFFLGVKLCAEKKLAEPLTQNVVELVPNKGPMGQVFKQEAKAIIEHMANMNPEQGIGNSKLYLEFGISFGGKTLGYKNLLFEIYNWSFKGHQRCLYTIE
jgi:hypothetical protein